LEKSAKAIEAAISQLIESRNGGRVDVAANQWGHLDVVIGTDIFRGVDPVERVDRVLDHLRNSLDPADFANVSKVWVLDAEEYEKVWNFGESMERLFRDRESDEEAPNG
jgi:hypothetical protein